MRIAFFVWNPFQIYQFDSVVRQIPGATYLLQRRKNIEFERLFTDEFMRTVAAPIRFLTREEMLKLDGEYDAIVCQTAFGHMEVLEKTKVVSMQYSMSKERHQYGPWRILCDLNLVYGQYSYDRLIPYGPCAMIGNPRFDRWFDEAFDEAKLAAVRARLQPAKKTVLYLPTWGQLSSMTDFGSAVGELGNQYNVIAKVHHKTDSHELSRKLALGEGGIQDIFGASDDLLHLMHEADVVISDYSGAIFDAVNVGKPVILLQRNPETLALIGAEKFGLESIEYARRDMIGPVVSAPEMLADTVAQVLNGQIDYREKNRQLKAECFAFERDCGKIAAEAIFAAVQNRVPRPNYQIYIRDMLREQRRAEEDAKLEARRATRLAPVKRVASRFVSGISGNSNAEQGGTAAGTKPRARRRRGWLSSTAKALLLPARRLVERSVERWAAREQIEQRPIPTPHLLGRVLEKLPSRTLTSLGARVNHPQTQEVAVQLLSLAYKRSKSVALTPYINILAKYKRYDELARLIDDLLSRPVEERARYLQRAARAQEVLGAKAAEVSIARHEVHSFLVTTLARSSNTKRNGRLMAALVANRWLSDAEALTISRAKYLSAAARTSTRDAVDRAKRFLERYYDLTEAANHNHLPALTKGDFICFHRGELKKVSDTLPTAFVEFLLPFYFFIEPETDKDARERICAMLRLTLDVLVEADFAVVPRHQFRLDNAAPTGHWPHILSYHTTGSREGWWHIKDAPLPGYFTIDSQGYSGWSSLADKEQLPEEARQVPLEVVEATWTRVREEFVAKHKSKYAQAEVEWKRPAGRYIFLPMQVTTDSVARLAWISTLQLAEALVEILPDRGYNLVIKRHPKCVDAAVAAFAERNHGRDKVYFTDASIHDVLRDASAVVTVNSGVGFEALLHGKPVITTGRSEYGVATRHAHTLTELASCIDALEEGVDLEGIQRFVHFYISHFLVEGNDRQRVAERVLAALQDETTQHV